jgi:hypothetical protein
MHSKQTKKIKEDIRFGNYHHDFSHVLGFFGVALPLQLKEII